MVSEFLKLEEHTDNKVQAILVIESEPRISTYLQELGAGPVVRFHHCSLNTGHMSTIAQGIKHGKYSLVWCDFPRTGSDIKEQKMYSHLTQLCQYFKLARQSGTPMVLFGSFNQLRDSQIEDLLQDKVIRKSYYRLCHFDETVEALPTGVRSATCFVAASTLDLPSNSCKCLPDTNHKLDWMGSSGKAKAKAQLGVACRLVAKVAMMVGLLHSTPDLIITQNFVNNQTCNQNLHAFPVDPTLLSTLAHEPVDPTLPPGLAHVSAFPTDSKVRAKKAAAIKKAAGETVIKKKVQLEDIKTDCGSDLSGLIGPKFSMHDLKLELADGLSYYETCLELEHDLHEPWCLPPWSLLGSDGSSAFDVIDLSPDHIGMRMVSNIFQLSPVMDQYGQASNIDVVEICGGEGRIGLIAVRRHLTAGQNFDLLTKYDLNDPKEQEATLVYFRRQTFSSNHVACLYPFWTPQ